MSIFILKINLLYNFTDLKATQYQCDLYPIENAADKSEILFSDAYILNLFETKALSLQRLTEDS